MDRFIYKALTQEGKKREGIVEAKSLDEAKKKVRALQLILVSITKKKTAEKNSYSLKTEELLLLTSQLTQLSKAQIPLYESLLALEEQTRGERLHSLVLSLGERIKMGKSFSQAIGEFPESFPPLYKALISAGETVGNLTLSLERLTELLAYQQKIKKQFISAISYPLFLLIVMAGVMTLLFTFVLPSLEKLFDDQPVPWFTEMMFSLSHMLTRFWPLVLLLFSSLLIFSVWHFKKASTRKKIDRLLLRLPLIKKYMLLSSLARFARTLGTLLEGRVPLPKALLFAENALNNAVLTPLFQRAQQKVLDGKSLSSSLLQYEEIPPLFSRMIKIGEETGKLPPMLFQVASMYEKDSEELLNRSLAVLQPLLLILMGIMVAAVILSVLLPLSNFGSQMPM